jgi:hypothetical protein
MRHFDSGRLLKCLNQFVTHRNVCCNEELIIEHNYLLECKKGTDSSVTAAYTIHKLAVSHQLGFPSLLVAIPVFPQHRSSVGCCELWQDNIKMRLVARRTTRQ